MKKTASVILAAGRGSRMKEFDGNKTLLPLISGKSQYEGNHPILLEVLRNLPCEKITIVINHKKEDVIKATHGVGITFIEQSRLNGTGGALLAARPFLERQDYEQLIVTMGDVPFVKKTTYMSLVNNLKGKSLVVLGFRPELKKQYGVLEIEGDNVKKIIEWKYWKTYSQDKQKSFQICNSGIYAARKEDLLRYLLVLASKPHKVHKKIDGKIKEVEEFFITDLIEYMHNDGLSVGYVIAEDEEEIMGIDDLDALISAQELYRTKFSVDIYN